MSASQTPRARSPHVPYRPSVRVALRNCLVVAAGLVLLAVLLAGCGGAPLPPAAPATIAPTTPPPAAPPPAPPTTPRSSGSSESSQPSESGPGTTGGTGGGATAGTPAPDGGGDPTGGGEPGAPARGSAAGAPIWPASDAESARSLQQGTDAGRQPWLLDPVEVATSYAGAELGYRNPAIEPKAPGTVDVRDGRSPSAATITLEQTVRPGEGGIWLVTGVQRR